MANSDAVAGQVNERAKGEFLVYFGIAANDIVIPALESFVALQTDDGYASKFEAGLDQSNNPQFTLSLIPGHGKSFPGDEAEAFVYKIIGVVDAAELKYLVQTGVGSNGKVFDEDIGVLQSLSREELDIRLLSWANVILS